MRQLRPEEQAILDSIPPRPEPKPLTPSMDKIEAARRLGLAGEDMSDPLNQIMRYGFFKDLRRDMKKGDDERLSTRDAIEYAILMRMLPDSQGGDKFQQMFTDMKAENEKLRQEMRELVLERKIKDVVERSADEMSNIASQLEDISRQVEQIKAVPATATPEQKKDGITLLEEAANQLERLKTTMGKFGFSTASAPSEVEKELFKNPDGSVNKTMFALDRLSKTVERGIEAWQKKTPEKGDFIETPAGTGEPQYIERRMQPEEYADMLLAKPSLSPHDVQWLATYRGYLAQQQTKLQKLGEPEPKLEPAPAQAEQLPVQGCRVCGRPGIYNDLCEQCFVAAAAPAPPERPGSLTTNEKLALRDEPKKGIIDRLKEAEEEATKRTQGLL